MTYYSIALPVSDLNSRFLFRYDLQEAGSKICSCIYCTVSIVCLLIYLRWSYYYSNYFLNWTFSSLFRLRSIGITKDIILSNRKKIQILLPYDILFFLQSQILIDSRKNLEMNQYEHFRFGLWQLIVLSSYKHKCKKIINWF